jgi:GAF domain-containing protein
VASQVLPDPFSPPAPRDRLRSEDLIADLFEAMHDLHFVRDALEGGEFCLSLAMEKVPARVGIVHLFDIDHREFVVTSTRGAGAGKLLARRHPESDAVLIGAMRKRRALVFAEASTSDAPSIARYADIGGVFSLIVAPVMQAGRFLGVIELADPLDGRPFTDFEGTAIFYIAEQFAELLGKIGVVVDPEAIGARALPEA